MPTYVITGSNRGLGLEFVRQLSSTNNANTIVAAVRSLSGDLNDLKGLAAKPGNGSSIDILECDTSSVSSIHAFAKECEPLLKDAKIDFLINNAGINAVSHQSSLTLVPEDLHQHMGVNVVGPAELVKTLAPRLQRGGLVVNMTSGLGSFGKGVIRCTTYAISKAALNMLTFHQAADLADRDVRVICMDPGWVRTRMGGAEAMINSDESIDGMLKVFWRVAERKDGGDVGKAKFFQYDGAEVPW